ncbi:MAG TPA: tetratricopeptide repeat protein [Bacteroidota bacterium]|nr:tetratricopeptide repeat protein [Bacteroidota bacterium]
MSEEDDKKRLEEIQRRAEELKRRAFEEEAQRLDEETEKRGQDLANLRRKKDDHIYKEQLKEAEEERKKQEGEILRREEEVKQRLEEERQKKEEEQRREEELQRRILEEEEARRRQEEEQRRREEEVRRRIEEEERHREELLRKEEEERQRKEEERRREEEEIRLQELARNRGEEERQERIQTLISNAEFFFSSGNYENAQVEIAKALVNDPINPEALELEQKIKDALNKQQEVAIEEKAKPKEQLTPQFIKEPKKEKKEKREKKPLPTGLIIGVVAGLLIIGITAYFITKTQEVSIKLAVLPLISSTNTSEEKMIGVSLSAEITDRLLHLKPQIALGYSSVYRLSERVPDPAQSIFGLGYSHILKGTISRTSAGLGITLKLVDSLGNVSWTREYEKKDAGIEELPDEISRQVLTSLGIQSESVSPSQKLHKSGTQWESYRLYLLGMEKFYEHTPQSMESASILFQQAYQKDDKFAEALAAAASVSASQIENGWLSGNVYLDRAKLLAEKAITTNRSLSEGYCALGRILTLQKNYRLASEKFDTALSLSPQGNEIYFHKAKLFMQLGRYSDALEALSRAYELNPRDTDILTTLAYAHQLNGDPRSAMNYHEMVRSLVSDSTEYVVGPFAEIILFDPALSMSMNSRIMAAFERRLKTNPKDYVTLYHRVRHLQSTGKSSDASSLLVSLENFLREELRIRPKNVSAMMYLALTYTREGKYPEALSSAKKALELEGKTAELQYKVAQMYAVQKKRDEAVNALREAVAIHHHFDELTNADFYNIYDLPEFRSAIKDTLK